MLTPNDGNDRAARLAAFDRKEWLKRLAIVLSLAAMAALYAWWARRGVDWDTMRAIGDQCIASYASARTQTDTAIVDQRAPTIGRVSAVAGFTCGELRRSGDLSRK